jgi:VIT1/CCC1 family predicted Fe2+/Mn2+ transporter
LIASLLRPEELEAMYQRLRKLPEPPSAGRLTGEDWRGAFAVLLLVFLSTFPVVIPFMIMSHVAPALRASNAIAIAMLFVTGFGYGRYAGGRPWVFGISMVIVGLLLVALTVALGG